MVLQPMPEFAWMLTVPDRLSVSAELRGIRCHLHRAAGPEPEARGDLPADRGACAWRYGPLRAMPEIIIRMRRLRRHIQLTSSRHVEAMSPKVVLRVQLKVQIRKYTTS